MDCQTQVSIQIKNDMHSAPAPNGCVGQVINHRGIVVLSVKIMLMSLQIRRIKKYCISILFAMVSKADVRVLTFTILNLYIHQLKITGEIPGQTRVRPSLDQVSKQSATP